MMDLQALEKLLSSSGSALGGQPSGDVWQTWKSALWALLPGVVAAVFAMAAFWLAARTARAILRRAAARGQWHPQAATAIAQGMYWSVMCVGLVTSLALAGLNVAALLLILGVAGLATALACKEILSNAMAGVLLLAYEPFARNDRIALASLEGTVAKIDLRYTTIKTDEGRVLIPNSSLLTSCVTIISERA